VFFLLNHHKNNRLIAQDNVILKTATKKIRSRNADEKVEDILDKT